MQLLGAVLAVLLAAPAPTRAGAHSASQGLSPITRVVELLQGLAAKVEEETKKEESLYETYVCWAKTVVSTKTASNEEAKSRIDSLKTYIDDLDNGRIELTSERADLEKELAGLKGDMETAEAVRAKEEADFQAAKAEMETAIAALEEATSVLEEVTGGGGGAKSEKLLAVRSRLGEGEGFGARAHAAEALAHAAALGQQFLSATDARFLQRLLSGDVPTVDWKKLNRKATFKMKYKARSGKIFDVLRQMLATFQKNLKEAEATEKAAQGEHDKLMAAKGELKDKTEESLTKLVGENGARGLSKADAESEVASLETQVKDDTKYIEETSTALEEKKAEWKERKALRIGEVAAITKAISILHSDDARDLFKRSFKSQQGLLLLEEQRVLSSRLFSAKRGAAAALQTAAARTGDARLAALAASVAALAAQEGGHFDTVIKAIDSMIETLKKEAEEDLKRKEECEADRAEDTKQASQASREIDDMSDAITKLEAEIEEIEAQVKEHQETIAKTEEELEEATRLREDEAAEWKASDADDKAALELIESATAVLEGFYKENGLSLLARRSGQPPEVVAGEAPPPPPATWEAPYEGQQGESQGIVGILTMIGEDVAADIKKAKAAEDEAQAAFDKFKTESEEKIEKTKEAIVELEDTKGRKEEEIKTTKEERATKKEELDAVIQKLKASQVGCDYISVNFEVRNKNRDIEIDGLTQAKGILEGMKSKGSAFLLQRVARE